MIMPNSRCLSQMHVDCRTPAAAAGVHLAAEPTRNPGTRANTRARTKTRIAHALLLLLYYYYYYYYYYDYDYYYYDYFYYHYWYRRGCRRRRCEYIFRVQLIMMIIKMIMIMINDENDK